MMAKWWIVLASIVSVWFAPTSVLTPHLGAQTPLRVASPDGRTVVTVAIRDGGAFYAVARDGRALLLPSRLGFVFRNAPPLRDSLTITGTTRDAVDATWEQPWGEVHRVRDHHNELRVSVEETVAPGRRFDVIFRVFDDGLGFRYELPEQPALESFEIMDELTEFAFADNARTGRARTARRCSSRRRR